MNENLDRSIDPNEKALNSLFKELLDGLRDDLYEAQLNVDVFHAAMQEQGMRDLYAPLYHEALKIKGQCRDRKLKFVQGFKERVTVKEKTELTKELKSKELNGGATADFNHNDMSKYIDELSKSGKLENIELDFEDEDDLN